MQRAIFMLFCLAVSLVAVETAQAGWKFTLPKPIQHTPLDPTTWTIPENEVHFNDAGDYDPPTDKFVTECGGVLEKKEGRQWTLKYDTKDKDGRDTADFKFLGQYKAKAGGAIWVFNYNGKGDPAHGINHITISPWAGAKDYDKKKHEKYPYALTKYYKSEKDQEGHFHEGWWGDWKK